MDDSGWTPWGKARASQRGVETAFHHRLIAVRVKGDDRVSVINPGDLSSLSATLDIDSWRPMPWAEAGRREWRHLDNVGHHSVFPGTNGRLFHTINAVCDQLFESDRLILEDINIWRQTIHRRVEWCLARNIVYRHLVIPEHHSIYADAIPGSPKLSDRRPLIAIMADLEPHVKDSIVYPLDSMIAGREKHDTSLPHDVHFTGYGAFLCYERLINSLDGLDPSEIIREENLKIRDVFIAGDLARAVGEPGRRVAFHDAPKIKHQAVIKGTTYRTNQVDVYNSEARSGRTLVMFRTSNSSHLIPYLLHHFSRISAVATTNVFYDLIEAEGPDVVIAEMPERYFASKKLSPDTEIYRSAPNDDLSFESQTGYALPLPRS